MHTLIQLFGYPHELLHALALRLIGRRAVSITQRYTDIPDDLTTRQYVFVAGLPALVFWTIMAVAALGLLSAATVVQGALAFVVMTIAGLAAAGTLGDVHLIITRLLEENASQQ